MFRPGTVVGIAKASDGTTIIGTDYCGVSNVILNLPNDRRIKDGIARDLHVGLLVRTYDRVKDSAREHALSYITRKGGFDCL